MSIQSQIHLVRSTLPPDVKMVAVSKFHPATVIRDAYDVGQRIFGESRVQELVAKQQELPEDIEWHFIGNLQRNKVKQIAPFISLIQSVESERLLREIDKQGAACERVIPCLLQIHIAEEESKSGFSPDACRQFMRSGSWRAFSHVKITGVMGMATFTDNREQLVREFRLLRSLYDEIKGNYFPGEPSFSELSMGMSGDYPIAVEEGSTMVRLGSVIFGER